MKIRLQPPPDLLIMQWLVPQFLIILHLFPLLMLPSPSSQNNYRILIISTQHMVVVPVPFIFQTWSNFTLYYISPDCQLSIALCISHHYFLTLFGFFADWKKITFNFIFRMKKPEQYCCGIYSSLTSTTGNIAEEITVLFITFCRAEWGLYYTYIICNGLVPELLVNICICFLKVLRFNEHDLQI